MVKSPLTSTHWVYSITTRIKTSTQRKFTMTKNTHWVYSITTRIKTLLWVSIIVWWFAHWVYSITTRIKTNSFITKNSNKSLIEYIPLQQGLRPKIAIIATVIPTLIEYIPLQQGLRPLIKLSITFFFSLSIFHYNKD